MLASPPRFSELVAVAAAAGGHRAGLVVLERLGPTGLELWRTFVNVDCSYVLHWQYAARHRPRWSLRPRVAGSGSFGWLVAGANGRPGDRD